MSLQVLFDFVELLGPAAFVNAVDCAHDEGKQEENSDIDIELVVQVEVAEDDNGGVQ